MAESITQEALIITGMAGATAGTRFVGGTTSGAPTTGTFAVGDYVVDQTGAMYVCTVAGTPGTWKTVGVPISETVAGKNYVINGGLDIWQRGTTTSSTTGNYTTADRWYTAGGGSAIFSQDTDVPSAIGVQYSFKWTTTNSGSFGQFYQGLEQAVVKPLRGQVVTLSAWCKTVNYGSGNQFLRVNYSNSTDALNYQNTSVQDVYVAGNSLGSWTRITSTFTIPTDAVGLAIEFIPDTVQASGVAFKMTGVQLEIASTATAFSRAGGTIQGELAACQRYYWRNTAPFANMAVGLPGIASSSTLINYVFQLPITMRIAPTTVETSGLQAIIPFFASSNLTYNNIGSSTNSAIVVSFSGTGMTASLPYFLYSTANNSYIGISAEL